MSPYPRQRASKWGISSRSCLTTKDKDKAALMHQAVKPSPAPNKKGKQSKSEVGRQLDVSFGLLRGVKKIRTYDYTPAVQ